MKYLKQTLLIALTTVMLLSANAQSVHMQWAKSYGSTTHEDLDCSVADTAGNIYYAGRFDEKVDLNPGTTVAHYIPKGNSDAYLVKVDKYGNLGWVRTYGYAGTTTRIQDIKLDNNGNLVVLGQANTAIDFDEGPNVVNLPQNGTFLMKMSTAGKYNSLVQIVSSSVYKLAIDHFGNSYIIGTVWSSNVDFDPSGNTNYVSSAGGADVFVTKLTASNAYTWTKRFGGGDDEYPNTITVDKYGNVYISGYFKGTSDMDPGAANVELVSKGSSDVFVCKLTGNGLLVWARQIGSTEYDYVADILADDNMNVLVTGSFEVKTDFNPGAGVFELTPKKDEAQYLLKLNSAGDFQQVTAFENTFIAQSQSLSQDKFKNIYVSGNFTDSVDVDPSSGVQIRKHSSFGDHGMFVAVLDTTLNYISDIHFGNRSEGLVSVFGNGGLYVLGTYWYKIDCDPGPDTAYFNSLGVGDVFLAKYEIGEITSTTRVDALKIIAFPNPTEGMLNLQLPNLAGEFTATVFNISGKKCSEALVNNTTLTNIQMPDAPGVYMVKVQHPSGVSGAVRIIKK